MHIFTQYQENKELIIKYLNEILNIELKDIIFDKLEKFQSIAEYDFYLINFIGITNDNEKKNIFIKKIKKGKIKESLFCICDLVYEKYFSNKECNKKIKKITIIEEANLENLNRVAIKLFDKNLSQSEFNIQINFINIFTLMSLYQKLEKKGWEEYIEVNPTDMLIIGVKNGIDLS